MKMTKTLAAFSAAFLLSSAASAAQFYKWTDEQGVTHYSEEAPPSSASKASEVKVRTKLPSGSSAAAAGTAKAAADVNKAAPKKDEKAGAKKTPDSEKKSPEQYAEKCKTLKENLEAMQSHGRVRETTADGTVHALSEEEKQQRMDETQRQIKAFCEG